MYLSYQVEAGLLCFEPVSSFETVRKSGNSHVTAKKGVANVSRGVYCCSCQRDTGQREAHHLSKERE